MLALVPAFLLAHYRQWYRVSVLLGVGIMGLALFHVAGGLLGFQMDGSPVLFFVLVPYLAVALGAGWFSEVRRHASERSKAEANLRRLEKALDTMQMGVTISDLDGHIIYVNPADARMHGYTVEALLGQSAIIYVPNGQQKSRGSAEWRQWSSYSRESSNIRRDGTRFPVFLRSDIVRDVAGEPVALVTTCEDITERKRAEEELKQTNAAVRRSHEQLKEAQLQLIQAEKLESIGRMAAGVAHEVKNPLMTILTGVKYVAKRIPETDDNLTLVFNDVTDAIGRADSIIKGLLKGLLSFSAAKTVDVAQVSPNVIVERSLLLVKHELAKNRVSVVTELDDALPTVKLDEFKMQQVLVNVFTNAAHAMADGGQLHVRTFRKVLTIGGIVGYRRTDKFLPGESVVVLQVEDTGPGIPPKHLSKLFDPFFTTKPTGVGTGLGLSVSRQIVEMHRGSIEIENGDPGGARVTITLPERAREDTNGEEADSDRRR